MRCVLAFSPPTRDTVLFGCMAALSCAARQTPTVSLTHTQTHTLSAHDLSHMLGAGHRDALRHVDALLPGLLAVVVQRVLVVVQAEQGELVQGDLQRSLVVQRVSLDAAVGEQRAGHVCGFAGLRVEGRK